MDWETIIEPGFVLTEENTLQVMRYMMDVNKPGGRQVREYLLTIPQDDLMTALKIGFDTAEKENDQDWCYFMHNVMERRMITFEQLNRTMPDVLKRIVEE